MVRSGDTPKSPTVPALAAGSCRHCGRAVHETLHTRTSYVVDGYVLHTGPTESAVVRRADSDEVFVYQRLLHPITLVVCAACYADPARRAIHLSWSFAVD